MNVRGSTLRRTLIAAALVAAVSLPATSHAQEAADPAPAPAPPADPAATTPPSPAPPLVEAPSAAASPPLEGVLRPPAVDAPGAPPVVTTVKLKPRPFAGSSLYLTNSMTTGTVFRGQQQHANPTVESSMWLLPRYAINEAFQLRGRLILSYEFTNSDSTTYRNEPLLSDTSVQLFYRKIPLLPGGIKAAAALNVSLPTSKLSRARTLIFSPGATLQLSRPFDKMLGGDGQLLGSVIYSHPIYGSTTAEVVDPRPPGAFQCVGGNGCQDFLSGTMNTSNVLSYVLLFEMSWGHWNPAIYYAGASQWVYTPRDVVNPIDGTPIGRPPGFEPTSVRQTHYFSAWLDYDFNTWLTGEVGFWNSISALGGDGQRANLIFSRYQDTRVYLGASFQLDNLAQALQGKGAGSEPGVVRAKNTKQPLWSF